MTWTRLTIVGAALLAGCTGTIGANSTGGSGAGNTTGGGTPTGSGNTTGVSTGSSGSTGSVTGAGGTNAVMPMPIPTTCTPGVPATSQLPRLTQFEYDNTAKDLLFIDIKPSSMLAPDTTGPVDQRAWDGFQQAADTLATQVMANATAKAKVLGCTPSGDGSACAQSFIQTFGQRAFRRPLTATEQSRFMALFTDRAALTESGTFDQIAQVILKAFLMSPSFISKTEISTGSPSGSNFALNGYEMASRLSYMLWGSMPDDTLFMAAAANQLSTPAQLLQQAQRMLTNEKARAKVADFHEVYALMGEGTRWAAAAHDATKFPNFKPAMVPTLTAEAKRFFDYVTFDLGGSFQDLILKPVAFINKDLAPIYGLNPADYGTDLKMTNLDQTQRAGLLTQAGFLGSYSSFDRTSPILRGAFIEKQILCREIPAPPPGATDMPLPTTGTTNRERVAAQTAGGECTGCHTGIVNPPGFAMEAYDSIGAWQTTEKGTSTAINTVSDVLIGSKSVHVTGPIDLMKQIAASPEGQSCYARRWVQYAYERDLTSQDVCTVQSIATKMSQGTYTIQNLITDLTQSDSFRLRAKEL